MRAVCSWYKWLKAVYVFAFIIGKAPWVQGDSPLQQQHQVSKKPLRRNQHNPTRHHETLHSPETLLADPEIRALANEHFAKVLNVHIGEAGIVTQDDKDPQTSSGVIREEQQHQTQVKVKVDALLGKQQDDDVCEEDSHVQKERRMVEGVNNDDEQQENSSKESDVNCDDENNDDDHDNEQSRRLAQGSTRSNTPWMYPAGGIFYHPIAVTFVSARDADFIYYTLNGSDPTLASPKVLSGGSTGISESAIVKLLAGPGEPAIATRYSEYLSAGVLGNFTIKTDGKCGKAIMVPYFTPSGYSGTTVQVHLDTSQYHIVRMHNLYTDWADFYSDGGIGPYDGQVMELDMANGTVGGLRGYWGGFSTRYNGAALGFFSPMFDGQNYHGKAVQVAIDAFGTPDNVMLCGPHDDIIGQDTTSNTSCVFKVLDLEVVDSDLRGFSGGFTYNNKAYFVPTFNGRTTGTKLVRVNVNDFTASTVEVLDLAPLDQEIGGFSGGFVWNGYGFLVPGRQIYTGPFGGINSNLTVDGIFNDVNYPTATTEQSRRVASLTTRVYSGKLVRVNLTTFDIADCSVMDLTGVDPDLRGFMGGFVAGKYGTLVPFKTSDMRGIFSGKIAMVDLERWGDLDGVRSIDLARKDPSLTGFAGGFNFGKYAVFVPYINGDTLNNSRQRSQSSKLVFVDLQDLQISAVRVVDVAKQVRQQIPSLADADLRGFIGGFPLGPHIYLSPHFNGVFFGKIIRLDMRDLEVMAHAATPSGHDGMQVLDLLHNVANQPEEKNRCGFSSMIHSFDQAC